LEEWAINKVSTGVIARPDQRRLWGKGAGALAVALGAVGAGALIACGPQTAILAVAAAGAVAAIALAPYLGRCAALAAFAGNLVLLYGFANLGVPTGWVAVPLTDVLLVVAFLWAVGRARGPAGRRALRWWVVLVALGLVHLLLALPRYGLLAVRDFLPALESSFLIVGYRLGAEGWPSVERRLRWVYLACALYFAAYPARDWLAAVSPTAGIQRDVPLLGQYAGAGPAAIGGFFLMALLRPFGRWSYLVAGVFLAELLIFQARGGYLAFVAAVGLLFALAGPSGRRGRVRSAIGGALVVTSSVAALVLPLVPAGRLGPVSPEFYTSHIGTLLGHEGPGAGSIRDRLEWTRYTVGLLTTDRYRLITGVGYGPSLTGGFAVWGGVPVRQPHDDYLEILARMGIPGLVSLAGLLASVFVPVLRAARRASAADARFMWWIVAAIVPYLLVAAVQPLLPFPYGTVPLFTLGGIALAVVDRRAGAGIAGSRYPPGPGSGSG